MDEEIRLSVEETLEIGADFNAHVDEGNGGEEDVLETFGVQEHGSTDGEGLYQKNRNVSGDFPEKRGA